MRQNSIVLVASMALALLLVASCGAPAPPTATATATSVPATPTVATEPSSPLSTPATESPLPTPALDSPMPTPVLEEPAAPAVAWTPDGIIADDEYDQQLDLGDIRVWWRHDEISLYIAFEGDTTGWVAVGINPQRGMQGADYLFGYVKDGEAALWDAFGTAPTGPNHPPDTELGGTDDIVSSIGVEEEGVTRFEVQIPLDSGDAYDHRLEPGMTYPIIVAIGGEDDFDVYHLRYDSGELILP